MYYKIDQHSSSFSKGTPGLLHILGSNTMIFFAVLTCDLYDVRTLCYKLRSFYIDYP